jgi:hypothetical protein
MVSLKKEDFSPPRRKDRQDFLWSSSVLGALSALAVPFSVDSRISRINRATVMFVGNCYLWW